MSPRATGRAERISSAYREHERYLWSVAYRMTGSGCDADDVVQEAFVRALERPPRDTGSSLRPWLVTVVTNLAKDLLRKRRRREYRGQWLPSPVFVDSDFERVLRDETRPSSESESPDRRYDVLESVSMAFLIALEALTPQQRAVLLLRDVMDYDVRETAEALDIGLSNVKTTLHRARRAMAAYDRERGEAFNGTRAVAHEALETFVAALRTRDAAGLQAVLSEDVVEISDAGGEFIAAVNPIVGRDRVSRFFLGIAPEDPSLYRTEIGELNGMPAVFVTGKAAAARTASRFVVLVDLDAGGRIRRIYNVLATEKLSHAGLPG